MICRKVSDLPHKALRARLESGATLSCNSSDKAIAILRAYRAYRLARWLRFVSIERREPLQTSLQGTSARAMIFRNSADLPRTALRARSHTFLQFTLHPNRLSTGLQGISLTRWHRFVSIERPEPLWTALQGISARAMVCRRKNSFAKPSEPNTRSTAEKSGATSD